MRETNGNFYSCNSCKRLGTSRFHELHESKFPFVSLSNLSVRNFRIFPLMHPGVASIPSPRHTRRLRATTRRLRATHAVDTAGDKTSPGAGPFNSDTERRGRGAADER